VIVGIGQRRRVAGQTWTFTDAAAWTQAKGLPALPMFHPAYLVCAARVQTRGLRPRFAVTESGIKECVDRLQCWPCTAAAASELTARRCGYAFLSEEACALVRASSRPVRGRACGWYMSRWRSGPLGAACCVDLRCSCGPLTLIRWIGVCYLLWLACANLAQ